MRPISVTVSDASAGAKNSGPIILDYFGDPTISLQVAVTGTVNWTVQQTLDNPQTIASPTWFDHPDTNMVAQTVNRQGNYAYVPASSRIVLNSGAGSVVYTIIQSGISR